MQNNKDLLLSFELLDSLFAYDNESGMLCRKTTRGGSVSGSICNHIDSRGYYRVKINSIPYRVHKIVWILCNKELPKHNIDHINRDKLDNRIENLRDIPQSINNKNHSVSSKSSTGCSGITNYKKGMHRACIFHNKKNISLGVFDNIEDAISARKSAEEKLWTPLFNN